jgi:hypothetical protein
MHYTTHQLITINTPAHNIFKDDYITLSKLQQTLFHKRHLRQNFPGCGTLSAILFQ